MTLCVQSSITLQFIRGRGSGSCAIEWFGHGPVSHVDALLDDGRLLGARANTIGDVVAGVQVRPPEYAAWSAVYRVTMPANAHQIQVFWTFLSIQIGKPYDHIGIAGYFLGHNWRNLDAWYCSELIGRALEVSKVFPNSLFSEGYWLTPPDLLRVCSVLARIEKIR